MVLFYKLQVLEIKKETKKTVSVIFAVPDEIKENFVFKAGQYLTIKKQLNGVDMRRDYSICSSRKSGILKIAIKAVNNGTFSVYMNEQLKVGDFLEVSPPKGRFTFVPKPSKARTVIAFAAGSGITPIMSIAHTLLEEEPLSTFILIYGNQSPKETIFLNEINRLQANYKNQFKFHEVYSRTRKRGGLSGHIDAVLVKFMLNNQYGHLQFDAYYICGPEAMIDVVKQVLKERKVSSKKIYFELFRSAISELPSDKSTTGLAQVAIVVDDERHSFTMTDSESILEAALLHDIDAPYSCKGGVCGNCIAKILNGKARMLQNNVLTDKEVSEGLILTCQARPESSNITVDYDDV